MSRVAKIGTICNFYPAFVIGHLIWGDWCRFCQIMFNVVPIAVFGGLFLIWLRTSEHRLNALEKLFLGYLITILTVTYCYYCICIFSSPKWVYSHNFQFAIFTLTTATYYTYEIITKNVKR